MKLNVDFSHLLNWRDRAPIVRLRAGIGRLIVPAEASPVPEMVALECAYDARHGFLAQVGPVPTPAYCSPSCQGAAQRLALRRAEGGRA